MDSARNPTRIPPGQRTGFRPESARTAGAREHAYEHAPLKHFTAQHGTAGPRHGKPCRDTKPNRHYVTRESINEWSWQP